MTLSSKTDLYKLICLELQDDQVGIATTSTCFMSELHRSHDDTASLSLLHLFCENSYSFEKHVRGKSSHHIGVFFIYKIDKSGQMEHNALYIVVGRHTTHWSITAGNSFSVFFSGSLWAHPEN